MQRRALLLASLATGACAYLPSFDRPDPEHDAAFLALAEQLGADPPADATPAGAAALRSAALDRFTELSTFEPGRLGGEARILYEAVYAGASAEAVLARRFEFGDIGAPYVVTHRSGAHRRVRAGLGEQQSAALVRDLDGESRRIAIDADDGVVPPRFLIERALASLQAAAGEAGEERADLAAALARQREALLAVVDRAPERPGVRALRDGEDYYAQILQLRLGAEVDPHDAFLDARERVSALHETADSILRAEGLRDGSVAERLRALARDERYLYADDESGRQRALAEMNERLADIRARLPQAFAPDLAATPAQILRTPEEAAGTAGRREPGAYLVDLGAIRARPDWTLASVVFHETLPGHLLQAAAAGDAPPIQARYAGGYSEGWAVYAETLAEQLGGFEHSPRARLGFLQWLMFRIGRIAVDAGVHRIGWDRARAVAEMYEMQGGPIAFVSIEEDVDRICAQPGVYAAQGLAALSFSELRADLARRPGFSLPRFHDAVLRRGPMAPPGLARAAAAALSP